jgi:galactokinase
VLSALCDLAQTSIPASEQVLIAQRAENSYVGAPTGILDQSASLLCQEGHALLLDCRTRSSEQVPFAPESAGLQLVVIDTRVTHAHSSGEYRLRRTSCEQAAEILGVAALRDVVDLDAALEKLSSEEMRRRVRHVVTENARVLATVEALRAGDWSTVGDLFTASHASMRDDYEITVPEVDLAVSVALDQGALGARMTGGGFGGCVLALVPADAASTVRSGVAAAFEKRGFGRPASFIAHAGAGAHRLPAPTGSSSRRPAGRRGSASTTWP